MSVPHEAPKYPRAMRPSSAVDHSADMRVGQMREAAPCTLLVAGCAPGTLLEGTGGELHQPAPVASHTGTAEAPAPADCAAAEAALHRDRQEEALAGIEAAPVEGHATAPAVVEEEGRMTRIAGQMREPKSVPCPVLVLRLHAHWRREVDRATTKAPTRFVCNWWAGAGWRGVDLLMQSCICSHDPR